MNRTEYKRLRKKFEEEYIEKMRALDMIWSEMHPKGGLPKPAPDTNDIPPNGSTMPKDTSETLPAKAFRRGELLRLVLEATSGIQQEEFSSRDIHAHIIEVHPDVEGKTDERSISNSLKKLETKGKLQLVKVGKGRAQSVYSKK